MYGTGKILYLKITVQAALTPDEIHGRRPME